jgi:predicted metalloprotease
MADWGKIISRGKVSDRRSIGPVAFGGMSITGVALLMLFNVLTGGSAEDVLGQLTEIPVQNQNMDTSEFAGQDSYEVFASTVLGSNNDMWTDVFNKSGKNYIEPTLVLFRTATESGCGYSSSEMGPHYCPLDKTIYLDETFFAELQKRYGARGGDVAEAYVISHEVGHHVQQELGLLQKADRSGSNEDSIKLELQADCFAGLWANSIKDQQVFEKNEIIEAMDAASAVGDDRIQQKVAGYVNPETWTHGSSAERVEWFSRGYESGSVSSCNTF